MSSCYPSPHFQPIQAPTNNRKYVKFRYLKYQKINSNEIYLNCKVLKHNSKEDQSFGTDTFDLLFDFEELGNITNWGFETGFVVVEMRVFFCRNETKEFSFAYHFIFHLLQKKKKFCFLIYKNKRKMSCCVDVNSYGNPTLIC